MYICDIPEIQINYIRYSICHTIIIFVTHSALQHSAERGTTLLIVRLERLVIQAIEQTCSHLHFIIKWMLINSSISTFDSTAN